MPRMTRFRDPIKLDLNEDWALVASSGGLYGDGTRLDIHLYNGALRDANIVSLSAAGERTTFATRIADLTGLAEERASDQLPT